MGLLPLLALTLLQFGEKPTATVKLAAASATVGKPLKGTLTLSLPAGWHGYQNPPAGEFDVPIKLTVIEAGFKLGKVDYPKGTDLKIEGQEKPSRVYEGTVTIPFTLVASKPLPKNVTANVNLKVEYQLCNSSSCLPPDSLVVKSSPLKVVAAPMKKAKKP